MTVLKPDEGVAELVEAVIGPPVGVKGGYEGGAVPEEAENVPVRGSLLPVPYGGAVAELEFEAVTGGWIQELDDVYVYGG